MKLKIFIMLIILTASPMLFSDTDEPVAVVLAGGGARGAYQVGVWRAMLDVGIKIGAVYGVSVGAINGAVMAMGDYKTAKELWLNIEKDDVMKVSEPVERVLSGEISFRSLLDTVSVIYREGGIDVSPLERLLRNNIDEESLRKSGVDYGLAAYSITDSKEKFFKIDDIPDNQLLDHILASANFPLFQRKIINGESFIDGGIQKNMVIEMVDGSEFKKAVIIALDLYTPEDLRDWFSGYSTYESEILLITPGIDLGSLLDFNPANALELMRIGYLDGLRAFGALSGNAYYIYGSDTIRKMYLQLDEDDRRTAVRLLEVEIPEDINFNEGNHSFDMLAAPEFRLLSQSQNPLLELYAFGIGLPRDELYSEADLIGKIVDSYIHRPNFGIYYSRHLDFLSYIYLMTEEVIYFDEEFNSVFIESYESFKEEK